MKEVETVERYESLDMACLRELRELTSSSGNPDRFRNLIDLFLGALQNDLQSMRAALAQRNAAELLELAHGLKGTSGSMGATYMAILCSSLENAAADVKLAGAENLVREIEEQAFVVRQIMLREVQG